VYEPDIVVVQDPSLLSQIDVTSGLQEGGIVLINTDDPNKDVIKAITVKRPDAKLYTVDASQIAQEEIGLSVTNTAILGALCKITKNEIIDLKMLENAIQTRFKGKGAIADKNIKAINRSYAEVKN
jgi:pyruvate ferredoxin oxidoreductase gamma subunit/2-oxoisovalerate ferredoxin oxidoreductase gamma subunit